MACMCQTVYWYAGQADTYYIQQDSDLGTVNWRNIDGQNWQKIRFLQAFVAAEAVALGHRSDGFQLHRACGRVPPRCTIFVRRSVKPALCHAYKAVKEMMIALRT